MSKNELIRVPIVTDALGAFTYDTGPVNGTIDWYRYVPGASGLDVNWDLDIVGKISGVVVANHDNLAVTAATFAPRQATHAIDGSASLYAGAGEPVEDKIGIADEQLTVTIAQGGNVKSGTLFICVRSP